MKEKQIRKLGKLIAKSVKDPEYIGEFNITTYFVVWKKRFIYFSWNPIEMEVQITGNIKNLAKEEIRIFKVLVKESLNIKYN